MFVLFDTVNQEIVHARKKNGYYHQAKRNFNTVAAAKAAKTRLAKIAVNKDQNDKYWGQDFAALEIITAAEYTEIMENSMVERVNLMSGKKFMIRRDAPACTDPSTETYWSM